MIQSVNDGALKELRFHESGTYRIAIQGKLEKHYWFNRLGEGTMTTHTTDHGTVTTLVCPCRDQAALLGLLNALYDWHFPLLQVEYLAESTEPAREPE